ncbi:MULTISPECIES: hypothetical protein [Streptomyces]|uniref:Lipoprotein n=1 Tax=Streptomyces dengpaensis TaxID=2049881 RepID=A0ABN5I0M8_9ACTN|nr:MULTISPECIES: hypothetical protein [Streptomyces]AVH56946.1 hypothetical protein C4B68_15465 [Streptomyces dengpaensis]PIB09154.1 hypothetical protein B1C81_13055 [Streptomyces sp. HG99]
MADTRRQLRSGTVVLGGMGLLAAALTACSSDPDKRCVDRDSYNLTKGYKVVADKNCKSAKTSSGGAWYYGGKKNSGWVDGGSFTKPKGSGGSGGSGGGSSVDRGGFGSGKGSSGG